MSDLFSPSMVDFHNHVIPGVDDGSTSLDESLGALEKMWRQGIRHVITTPHFRASALNDAREFGVQMGRIDDGWRALVDGVSAHFPEMKIDRGVELALDEPTVGTIDPRVRLAGTRFVLVEFPYFSIPPNSVQALLRLKSAGAAPIVAHPERYQNVESDLQTLLQWRRNGAFLQLNAGSLIGAYGRRAERIAWRCLQAGAFDYISSDYHSRGICLTAAAQKRLEARGGAAQFRMLASQNGSRLLAGLDPTPVVPLASPKSRWHLLKALFGRGD